MLHGVPVLAFGPAEVKLAILLIAVAGWLVRKVFALATKELPRDGRPAGQPVPRPPKAQPQAEVDLNKEIEEFVKRAAQRRGAQTRRAAQRRGAQTRGETAAPAPADKKPPRRLVAAPPTLESQSDRSAPLGAGIAEHVEKHLGTEEFNVRAAHLADDVVRSEQDMQQHLKQTFSHQVGRLADTSRQATEDKAVAAAAVGKAAATAARAPDLAALLADPNRLRQAIVVNEILQRPEHRW